MKDLVVLALTLGFFALGVAYVALCDRIIGPDELPDAGEDGDVNASHEGRQDVPATVTQ